jgi:hypothetical protein
VACRAAGVAAFLLIVHNADEQIANLAFGAFFHGLTILKDESGIERLRVLNFKRPPVGGFQGLICGRD